MTEYQLQCAIAEYLEFALPNDVWWTAIPHGEYRPKATAGRLKRSGVKPGAPDFMIVADPMIFIEAKAPKGRLSPAQTRFGIIATMHGHKFYEARSVDEVERALRECGVPVAGSVMA